MTARDKLPAVVVTEAVAVLAADGRLEPANDAMRDWVARHGDRLDELGLAHDALQQLRSGGEVEHAVAGRCWWFRGHVVAGEVWLVVRDGEAAALRCGPWLAGARARQLGGSAAQVAHDLNNRFAAVLSVVAQIAMDGDDAGGATALRQRCGEFEDALRSGSRMLSVLARLLGSSGDRRDAVAPHELCEDAFVLVEKQYSSASVQLTAAFGGDLPSVRVDAVQVVQAITAVLQELVRTGALEVVCTLAAIRAAIAGGRDRALVELQLVARDADAARLDDLLRTLSAGDGQGAGLDLRVDGLLMARLVQQLHGGDLLMERVAPEQLVVRYRWPAVARAVR